MNTTNHIITNEWLFASPFAKMFLNHGVGHHSAAMLNSADVGYFREADLVPFTLFHLFLDSSDDWRVVRSRVAENLEYKTKYVLVVS